MASLQGIADGLVRRFETVAGLRAHAWRHDATAPPSVEVGFPTDIAYDQTFGLGKTRWTVPCFLYASRADAALAQQALAPYFDDVGGRSLKAAVEADPTLDGAADTCVVARADQFGVYPVNGADYLGCRLLVEVWTS